MVCFKWDTVTLATQEFPWTKPKPSNGGEKLQNLVSSFAEFNLGEAYITGFGGVKGNKEKAIKWIKSPAEHDHESAQEVYGKIEKWGFENVKKTLP